MKMARVLMNYHRNVAVEVQRGSKWTTIVTGWTPTHREKILNETLDREWYEISYPITAAIERFLNPILPSSTIDDTAKRDLKEILKHETKRV